LDDFNSAPDKTVYEKNQKEEMAYNAAWKLYHDEFLPKDAKDKLYKKLEVSPEEVEYYKISKEEDGDQLLFISEQISTMGDDERAEFLLRARSKVNDKVMLTDTLVNKLVKSGEISSSLGNALKSVYFVKDNSYEGEDAIKMGDNIYKPIKNTEYGGSGGKGFGTGNVAKVKMPIGVKRSPVKSIKISTGSSGKPYTIKVTKPNLQKSKNWRSIKLKY